MEKLHIHDWYIVYTKSLREKKVTCRFSQKKIENYCPMKRVKREYAGHFKTTNEPLFTSYVFVQANPEALRRSRLISDVISVIHWLDKPAIIPSEEIEAIKKFLDLYSDIGLEKIPVCIDRKISFMHGPFAQEKETVPEGTSSFVKVELPSLGYALKASVSRKLITTIEAFHLEDYLQSSVTKFAS